MRLGKKAPKHDKRTFLMASYLVPSTLPPIPKACSWSNKAMPDFGMMLNDRLGDCTCAAMAHQVQVWTANTGTETTLSDQDVLAAYEGACGYNPSDPGSDQGGVELDVLNYWRKTGIGGKTIDAFVALEPQNHLHVKASINLFGGVYTGIALPVTAQNQTVWSVVPHAGHDAVPGTWGGHAVVCVAYDPHFVWCVTWGKLMRMTWGFLSKYMDEAYAVLSKDWFANGRAPSGFDYAALQVDLAAL